MIGFILGAIMAKLLLTPSKTKKLTKKQKAELRRYLMSTSPSGSTSSSGCTGL